MSISTLANGLVENDAPVGSIVLWSGSVATIPAGWAICDGTNGTPDLRGKFVVGAGNTYEIGTTGGSAIKSSAHSHNYSIATGSSGDHSHTWNPVTDTVTHSHTASATTGSASASSSFLPGSSGNITGTSGTHTHSWSATLTDPGHSHSGSAATSGSGTHTHTLSGTVSGGSSFDNLPPYYALAFVMKL